ncbi:MAG TPA: rhodanese-like domain-containing protein [Planctomycetota bacterium]|nr:rhodanese-like domain-containing protein [Planctomycetota bacterium]
MGNEISTLELRQLQDGKRDFALINVLSEAEFRAGSIPGSGHASVDAPEFLKHVELLTGGNKHMHVVVYCAGPRCDASTRAANILVDAGYTKVEEYRGGMEIWHSSPHGFHGQPGNQVASGDRRLDGQDLETAQGSRLDQADAGADGAPGKSVKSAERDFVLPQTKPGQATSVPHPDEIQSSTRGGRG